MLNGFEFGRGEPAAVGRDAGVEIVAGTFADFFGGAAAARDGENFHSIAFEPAEIERFSVRRPIEAAISFRIVGEHLLQA